MFKPTFPGNSLKNYSAPERGIFHFGKLKSRVDLQIADPKKSVFSEKPPRPDPGPGLGCLALDVAR